MVQNSSEKASMKRQWICIDVLCGPELIEELAAELGELFAVGVEILDSGVRFYVPGDRFLSDAQETLEQTLREFTQTWRIETQPAYSVATIPDEDWLEKWKADFKPLRVGRHLVVAPTWENVIRGPEDRIIWIDPGQAFGTGHHETTRLCLEWLEEWAEGYRDHGPKSLLDVGTGSGILAIAGALVGFDRILAVDNDPEALRVAGENCTLNGVTNRIVLQPGTVAAIKSRFDVVVANIQALPLMNMAQSLIERLNDSARLVLSGILLEQKEAVQSAFEREGLKLCTVKDAGEWCLLEFEQSPDARNGW
jgi:ribosomal protein L11 methyltransferase